MYLNPEHMTSAECVAIDAWMVRNGCRHHIAEDPIVIRGQWVEYVALCRKDPKSMARMKVHGNEFVPLGKRRLRIRVH